MVGMKLISNSVDGLHSTAIYLLKKANLPIQTSKRYMFLVKNDKAMYGLLTRSTDRATYWVWNALAQCQFPRSGGGCPMVGMKLISKPVDGLHSGLHSTAKYLLKEDNFLIQRERDIMFLVKTRQSYVWSIDMIDRPSDLSSEKRTRSVSIPAPRWWVSDGRNKIIIKTRRWATFYCHIFFGRV